MTPEERKAEFDRLFAAIPGKNIDKIRKVTGILFCKENTVRIYCMDSPTRVIPESKLKILKAALATK